MLKLQPTAPVRRGLSYGPPRALALQPQPAPYKADIEVKQIQTLTQEPEALERVPENSSAGTEPPPSAETDAQPLASSASQVSRVDQPPSDSACHLDEDSFKEEEALSEKKRRVDQPPWRVDQSPSDSACQPDEDSESFKEVHLVGTLLPLNSPLPFVRRFDSKKFPQEFHRGEACASPFGCFWPCGLDSWTKRPKMDKYVNS